MWVQSIKSPNICKTPTRFVLICRKPRTDTTINWWTFVSAARGSRYLLVTCFYRPMWAIFPMFFLTKTFCTTDCCRKVMEESRSQWVSQLPSRSPLPLTAALSPGSHSCSPFWPSGSIPVRHLEIHSLLMGKIFLYFLWDFSFLFLLL